MEPRGAAADAAAAAESVTTRTPLLAGVSLHHVHRGFDARVEVDLVPFALVDPAKSRRSLTIRSIRRRPSRVRSMIRGRLSRQ